LDIIYEGEKFESSITHPLSLVESGKWKVKFEEYENTQI